MTTKADEAEKNAYAYGERGKREYLRKEFLRRRQHAAIELCVPDSGEDWLDEMIQKARRDKFAGQALGAIIGVLTDGVRPINIPAMVKDCRDIADAMLKAGEA